MCIRDRIGAAGYRLLVVGAAQRRSIALELLLATFMLGVPALLLGLPQPGD